MTYADHDRTTPYVIAEAGVNHNGDLDMALRLVDAAAAAGADAVKFQTFRAESVVTAAAPKAAYQTANTGEGGDQLAMIRKLELGAEDFRRLRDHAREAGIEFLSTPFDRASVALLADDLGVDCLKVPSGEITNGPLVLTMARTGLPLIVSTGMATLGEVEDVLAVIAFGYLDPAATPADFAECRAALGRIEAWELLRQRVTLLHCTTEYPAPVDDVNLRAMDTMAEAFGLAVGYSDHTEGIAVPIAAAARGATVIEKHFTLDRGLPGPDHKASLEPNELTAMVAGVRAAARALGGRTKAPTPSETGNIPIARRSIVAAADIPAGTVLTAEMLDAKRPAGGLSPMLSWELVGRRVERAFAKDDPIEF